MKNQLVRRGALGLAAGALAVTGLSAIPTPAGAAIEYGDVRAEVNFGKGGDVACEIAASPDSSSVELVDNGVPVSQSWSRTGTVTIPGDPADVSDLSGSSQITASLTPIGAGRATFMASISASASASSDLADGVCWGEASSQPQAQAEFDLPHPMWASITGSGDGNGAAIAQVGDATGSVAALAVGSRGSGSASILLPAGPTQIRVQGQVRVDTDGPARSRSYAGSFTIELKPVNEAPATPGGAASAVSGKSKGVVVLGARDCATGNVSVDLTKTARKKAKQVLITVNGAKAAKLKGKKLKPRTLALPAAKPTAAEVVVRIKLKSGKKATVRRSYQACS